MTYILKDYNAKKYTNDLQDIIKVNLHKNITFKFLTFCHQVLKASNKSKLFLKP